MTNNFTPAKAGQNKPRLSKEEYAEKMRAEKEAVYQMADDTARAVVSDPEKFKAFLDEQNFAMVMEMLRAGSIEDEEDTRPSPLDELFAELEMSNPDHIALKYYRSYHSGAAKTLKSIQITLAARLEKFNLESLASLTTTDELDLPSLGEKKVALFALIPDNDSSFNFLVSILYSIFVSLSNFERSIARFIVSSLLALKTI